MIFKSEKKKKNPALAIALGAFAAYGAYSMICCVKDICSEKCKMITNMFKKKQKPQCCSEDSDTEYD